MNEILMNEILLKNFLAVLIITTSILLCKLAIILFTNIAENSFNQNTVNITNEDILQYEYIKYENDFITDENKDNQLAGMWYTDVIHNGRNYVIIIIFKNDNVFITKIVFKNKLYLAENGSYSCKNDVLKMTHIKEERLKFSFNRITAEEITLDKIIFSDDNTFTVEPINYTSSVSVEPLIYHRYI